MQCQVGNGAPIHSVSRDRHSATGPGSVLCMFYVSPEPSFCGRATAEESLRLTRLRKEAVVYLRGDWAWRHPKFLVGIDSHRQRYIYECGPPAAFAPVDPLLHYQRAGNAFKST